MKNILSPKIWWLLPLLLLGAIGCKKLLGMLTFNVNDATNFTIPATGPLTNTVLTLPAIAVASNSTSTYASNKTTANYVQDVTLDQLTLTVTDPSTQNFDFLKSISLYIDTDASGNSKTLLASLSPVPTGQTTIRLTPSGNKFDLYLRTNTYTLFTTAELAQPLPQATNVRADARFFVKANVPQ
ncbi:hypothetical protein QMK33_02780 [Hymenobacter sp. H14-R3]|uniref:hypothetical protein n=1 Tax=Hymenobacter sp. H14-R3 TaxID=3046308 RepID=UPI0024B98C50|nr:hypothetical protein [Hymenobacter sp. H14-R3]MDJ0364063.1 hypothetical protein [Hymenobacter sp. H14-R3]